ncbi:MAG TPA: hypothetical protein VG938_16315 [Verrucomicrobiae bacterium]|jgi:hypothetical protein|nr:hypothetical protein [Verrucomicrobiae bacterium]
MKSDNLLRHVWIPLVIAVVVYAIFYAGIEHHRTRNGPWRVAFTNDLSGEPALLINQPKLAITNLQITFTGETNLISTNVLMVLDTPQEVPYEVPFGKCVFMDTTFLPGTIVFDLLGHEIQLIPRVLTIDGKDIPWTSGAMIIVSPTNVSGQIPH